MTAEEFAAALEALTRGTLPVADHQKLEQHLQDDPAAIQAYVEQLRLHALLNWREGDVLKVERPQPAVAVRRWSRLAVVAGLASLAATILVAALLINFPPEPAAGATFAVVLRSELTDLAQPGSRVGAGQIQFADGEWELRLDTGSVVKLFGPFEGELLDGLSMRMTRGRLIARLEVGGQAGFTVQTPSAAVVDLSTEFGVAVEEEGRTDVVVFEGAVTVTPRTPAAETTRLDKGEAVRVEVSGPAKRLVSVGREVGQKVWSGRGARFLGCIEEVHDNLADVANRKCYQIVHGGLADGTLAYVDRDYTWIEVPAMLHGADYVTTFNEDKRQSDLELTIRTVRPARIYIFVDARSPAPAWLSTAGFNDTGFKIRLHETTPQSPQHPFSIWEKRQTAPGEVRLGPNAAKGMYAVAARADLVRVACLGDSITAGSGYVTELQSWLSPTHEVRNFGVSGATLLAKGDKPYVHERAYTEATAYQPDIVTLMLGTNDTKPQNFKSLADFQADCKTLLAPFLTQNPRPKIYLCLPVPVFFEGNFGIDQGRLQQGIIPALKAVAQELELTLIDTHTPLTERADLFHRDNVHPLGGGANLAAPIFTALTGKLPPVVIPPAPPQAIRLACLGDSITEGSGYPGALQLQLGNRVIVKNYGVSGATLLASGDKPYAKQAKFAAAESFAPDAVILMLGTNDTKPQNFKNIAGFGAALTALCEEIAQWKSRPKILLALPAPVIGEGNFGIDNGRLEESVLPAIRKVAQERQLPLIDLNGVLKPHPELFKDRVHPVGAQQMLGTACLPSVLATFPLPVVAENLLVNPSVEEGTAGWGTRGGKLELDPLAHTGQRALKVSERKAGFHGASQVVTAALKDSGMGYYQLRGALRLGSQGQETDAVLLVILQDSQGMRYCKTAPRKVSSKGWVDFADDVFLAWTGELTAATFCVETHGNQQSDLLLDDAALSMRQKFNP